MKDLTGLTFGTLTVLAASPQHGKWECECVCGRRWHVMKGNLVICSSKRCTCWAREQATKRATSHGMTKTSEHRVWTGLRNRCANPQTASYAEYGARGITCDPRWDDFERFLADIGPRPSPQHSVERRDNDGAYSPENCFWATKLEQANNKRNNTILTFDGRMQTLAQWSRETGIDQDALSARLSKLKWSVEKALTTPPRGWGGRRPRKK